ncbi:MAG TPA: histidinol-phosphate transaminase [Archaeoglobaceae archaeon]|nr:histidinol-phosphate transaminase [Archaeoglobaceae archaeon]
MIRNLINLINQYDAGKFPADISKKYKIRESDVIQLGSNENPYPPSKKVRNVYFDSLIKINRYPHPYYPELKESISSYLNVDKELIAVGNGAGDILRYICDVILEPMDSVIIPVPSFTLYAIFAMMRDASINFLKFPGYEIKSEEIPDSKLIFLCSPNNPTGNTIPQKEVKEILKNTSGYVVMDEAYAEFADKTCLKLIEKFDNLIVVRSFSKFFALAGLRIGYAVGNSEVIEAIEKVRLPFCITSVAERVAIAALDSIDYYMEIRDEITEEREKLTKNLGKLKFLEVCPSESNFILVKVRGEMNITQKFEERGIILRNVTGLIGLDGPHFRITVGTVEENERLLEVFKEIEI